MIKAKRLSDKNVELRIEGSRSDIILELVSVMTNGAELIGNSSGTDAESALFALIRSVCDHLVENGHDVDPKRIAISLLAFKDGNGPTGSGNSHRDQ